MLAARSPEDAEGMAGVLWIADAIEQIGDARPPTSLGWWRQAGHPRRAPDRTSATRTR